MSVPYWAHGRLRGESPTWVPEWRTALQDLDMLRVLFPAKGNEWADHS